jgi:hypothetical protein
MTINAQDIVMIPRSFFKTESSFKRQKYLHKQCIEIMHDIILFCERREIKLVFTSTVSTAKEDIKLKRKSLTHRQGRAFDVSLKGWKELDIKKCTDLFSVRYGSIAATKADGNTSLIVRHDAGSGDHLHFQISARFGESPELTKLEGKELDA